MITSEQLKHARRRLGWDRDMLSIWSGVTFETVRRAEIAGPEFVHLSSLERLQRTLENAGVEFPAYGPCVRRRRPLFGC